MKGSTVPHGSQVAQRLARSAQEMNGIKLVPCVNEASKGRDAKLLYLMRKSALVFPFARSGFIHRGACPFPLHSSPFGPRYLGGNLPRRCLVPRLRCVDDPN